MEHISNVSDLGDQMIYRGEGNSSIVIALKDRAKIIRLLKKDGKIMKSSIDHHATRHPMSSIKFIHLIMRPLTVPFLSGPIELVHLKSNLINMLSKQVEADRPQHRLDKTLHLDDQYALIMDDLCAIPRALQSRLQSGLDLCGPTISIEIKPKQGFLPIHRRLMKSTMNDKITTQVRTSCLYGSVQYLKQARGRIKEISTYCPVNLFSGCPVRMHSALKGLLNSPQNNFRIFRDLILDYGEGKSTNITDTLKFFFQFTNGDTQTCVEQEERLIELLIKCLLNEAPSSVELDDRSYGQSGSLDNIVCDRENNCVAPMSTSSCLRHHAVPPCNRCDTQRLLKKPKTDESPDYPHHGLPSACVLASVLRAQQLDTIGAQEAREMLDWLLKNSNSSDIIGDLSDPQIPRGFGASCRLSDETKEDFFFRKVWEFLVSLTAKDCSIIITLRRITPGREDEILAKQPSLKSNYLVDKKFNSHYVFNVGIADLDQKMPLKIYRLCEHINQTVQQLAWNEEAPQAKALTVSKGPLQM